MNSSSANRDHPARRTPIIPVWLRYIGGGILILNGLYICLLEVSVLISLFQQVSAGVIVTLMTPIGWFCFAVPILTAFYSLTWFDEGPDDKNSPAYWLRAIGIFISIFILTQVLYILGAMAGAYVSGLINNWLT